MNMMDGYLAMGQSLITIRQFCKRYRAACLLLFICLALTTAATWLIHNFIRAQQFTRFTQQATTAAGNVETYLSFILQAMRGMKGVFAIRQAPYSEELDQFMETVLIHNIGQDGGMRDIGLIWRVPRESTNAHIQAMKEANRAYNFRSETQKAQYYPIVYIHSTQANANDALGWDAFDGKGRSRAMMKAAETGEPVITEKIVLMDPEGISPGGGFVLYVPIYNKSAGNYQAPIERLTNLLGFAFCSIKEGKLWGQALQGMPALRMRVYDGVETKPEQLLFDSQSEKTTADQPLFSGNIFVDVLGRTWTFSIEANQEFSDALERFLPLGVCALGIVLSCSIFGFCCAETKARLRSEEYNKEVLELNEELENSITNSRKAERQLADSLSLQLATIEATADGLLVVDLAGKIITVNNRFKKMWNIADKVLQSDDNELLLETVLNQLVYPEKCAETFKNLSKLGEAETFDLIPFKDGKLYERYSFPQRRGDEVVGRVFSYRDVTMTQRFQDELRDSEQKYRRLVELSHDFIGTVDLEGRFSFANKAAKRVYGCEPEELIGRPFTDFVSSEQAEKDLKVFQKVFETGSIKQYVTKHRKKDGSDVWLSFNATVLHDDQGTIIGMMGSAIDITDRVKFEEGLKDSEALYHSLVENLPQFIFRKNLNGQFTYANQNFCGLLGVPRNGIMGKTDFDFCPVDLAAKYQRDDQWVLTNREMLETVETHELINGKVSYVQVVKTPIYDGKGCLTGIQGLFWDITERKIAEERLAHEKEQLAVTLASIADGVVSTDTDGAIKLMNRVAEDICGQRQSTVIGKPLKDIFPLFDLHSGKPISTSDPGVMEVGNGRPRRYLLKSKTNRELVVEQNASPLHDRDGRRIGSVFAFRNVTENHYLEQELLKASKLESLGVLAGGLAHDFNNILTAIVGNISLVRQSLRDTYLIARLQDVESAAQRAKLLTQQLLTFAKGGAPIKTFTSISDLIREAAGFALRGSRVRPELKVEEGIWAVHADQGQLEQVVHNIAINALQAMPNGGCLRIGLSNQLVKGDTNLPLPCGRFVQITFQDDGVGIPQNIISKIFDPYFTTKPAGHGLGLAMVYSIVKRHDGHIAVHSIEGAGSTFEVYLPATEPTPPAKSEQTRSDHWKGTGRILVMDDEPSIRALLTAILTHYGFEPVAVDSGENAIIEVSKAIAEKKPFFGVILDVTIPGGMGGKEAVKEIARLDPNIKAIVSSGYSNDPVLAEYNHYGFVGRIEKPYRADEVGALMRKIMEPQS